MSEPQQIIPGITIDAAGQATVDSAMSKVLFDLAIELEEPTNLPVDVQHVLAAIVLAARNGELDADTPISPGDRELVAQLSVHVKRIFATYGGRLGEDD